MDKEEYIHEKLQSGEDLGTSYSFLQNLYMIYSMISLAFGGIMVLGYITFGLLGWILAATVIPEFMVNFGFQGFLIMILGWIGLQVTFGIQELDAPSFSWALYLNIAQIVIVMTMGLYGLPFIALSVVIIALLFTTSVRSYWYFEWMEDMRPRIKETRYSMHLVRKSPLVVLGVCIIVFMISVAVLAPFIAPYGGEERIWADTRAAPGAASNDHRIYDINLWVDRETDIDLLPVVYSGGFSVFDNQTLTSTNPWLKVEIVVMRTYDDEVNVTITAEIYQLNYTEYQTMSEFERAPYLVNRISDNNTLEQNIQLTNETVPYTWIVFYEAPTKTVVWDVDVDVSIAYKLPDYPIHIWGADNYGGDVYSRVIWGAQTDIRIALTVVAVALSIGALLGAAAGYYGGKFDELIMRITDVFFAFPGLVLAMAIVMALGQRNLDNISIALMITWWPAYARLVRGQVLSEREKLYVEAARSVGASDTRILLFHIIPNTIQPVIVQATMDIGGVLLTAAGLSYIGFGPPVGTPEWGLMIASGQEFLLSSPWMSTFPGLAILATALAFNLVGDGIRDILDPKLRRR